jgi:Arm DNA-binding domain
MLTETEVEAIKPVRSARKIWDGRGLFLLVTPKGGRCWRYAYRFAKKYKKLALEMYPDVSLELARSRHEFAHNLLANGVDPAALKAALLKHIFAATMREWEKAPGHISELALCGHERDRAVPKAAEQSFKSVGVAPMSARSPRGAVSRAR